MKRLKAKLAFSLSRAAKGVEAAPLVACPSGRNRRDACSTLLRAPK